MECDPKSDDEREGGLDQVSGTDHFAESGIDHFAESGIDHVESRLGVKSIDWGVMGPANELRRLCRSNFRGTIGNSHVTL